MSFSKNPDALNNGCLMMLFTLTSWTLSLNKCAPAATYDGWILLVRKLKDNLGEWFMLSKVIGTIK
jgi:hypothetical protein